jgi:hypothetical protein
MRDLSRYLVVAIVAFLVALVAVRAGQDLFRADPNAGRLHALMHERLDLDPQQERRIDALEAEFATRRKSLDAELRAANADLARAIASEHEYGPAVEKAVDRSHHAMGELQKATLSHVFAMRAVLRPEQARRFDEAVARTLTNRPEE